jgi:hypothetical protein
VLVVRGDPGVGKSALLEYVAQGATGCRVERAAGVEYEMELAYAGLHQLCAPMLELRERLPVPQRDALETAFGLSAKVPPDGFVVGLAVLSLLSEIAEEQPLVCVVDDVQWLDNASAVTMARCTPTPGGVGGIRARGASAQPGAGASRVSRAAARGLGRATLARCSVCMARTPDEQVRDRVIAESRGIHSRSSCGA